MVPSRLFNPPPLKKGPANIDNLSKAKDGTLDLQLDEIMDILSVSSYPNAEPDIEKKDSG